MKKSLKIIILLGAAVIVFSMKPFSIGLFAASQGEFQKQKERIRALLDEISLINLINGLHLSDDQIRKIIAIATTAGKIKADEIRNTPGLIESMEKTGIALGNLKTEILKGQPAVGEIPKIASGHKKNLVQIHDNLFSRVHARQMELEVKLRSVLSQEQIHVVENFKPCLLPPAEMANPVRAGQAENRNGMIRLMREIREMPDEKWENRKHRIIREHVQDISLHKYRMTQEEKDAEVKRLTGLMEKIRSMPSAEYEIRKTEWSDELHPEDKLGNLRKELQRRSPHRHSDLKTPIGKYFLSKSAIPVLKRMLSLRAVAESGSTQ